MEGIKISRNRIIIYTDDGRPPLSIPSKYYKQITTAIRNAPQHDSVISIPFEGVQ